MSITKRKIQVGPSEKNGECCFICNTYLGPFKNGLNTTAEDSEKTIAEQLESLLSARITRKASKSASICQDCFNQLSRYNTLQRESTEIQQSLYNLYHNGRGSCGYRNEFGEFVAIKIEEPSGDHSSKQMTVSLSCQKCRRSFKNLHEMAQHTACGRDKKESAKKPRSHAQKVKQEAESEDEDEDYEPEVNEQESYAEETEESRLQRIFFNTLLGDSQKNLNAKISTSMRKLAKSEGIKYDIEAFHKAFGAGDSEDRKLRRERREELRTRQRKEEKVARKKSGVSRNFLSQLKNDGISYDLALFQKVFGYSDNVDYSRKLSQLDEGRGDAQASVKCSHCPETFTSRKKFVQHMRTHKTREFYCDECEKDFRTKVCLVIHNATDHERRKVGPFECPICFKSYNDRTALRTHYYIHVGERAYLCGICGADFFHKKSFEMHSLMHEDIRPFTCDVCKKGFRTRGKLTIHLRVHTGEKIFECPHCPGKRFAQKYGMDLHIKKTHMNLLQTYNEKCTICGMQLQSKSKLRQHLANAHEVAGEDNGEGSASYEKL